MEPEQQHLTDGEVEGYRERSLSVSERQKCDRHLASCPECMGQVLAGKPAVAVTRLTEAFLASATDERFHLSEDDLRRYLDTRLDEADRTIFESHLEDCPSCARALAGRRADTLAPGKRPSLWHAWWRPAMAGALALALLAAVWAVWHGKNGTNNGPANTGHAHTEVAITVADGATRVTLDESGNITGLEGLDPSLRGTVKEALTTGQLSEPAVLRDLAAPPIKLMGQSAAPPFAVIAPQGVVTAEERPVLSWQRWSSAALYTASVYDSQFRRIARSSWQTATEWELPVSLQRGETYYWEVTARNRQQQITVPVAPAPRARFKVLDQQTMTQLNTVKALRPDSHLTLGVLYAGAGLRQDAERELQALVDANPDSAVARNLLQAVRNWKGSN